MKNLSLRTDLHSTDFLTLPDLLFTMIFHIIIMDLNYQNQLTMNLSISTMRKEDNLKKTIQKNNNNHCWEKICRDGGRTTPLQWLSEV